MRYSLLLLTLLATRGWTDADIRSLAWMTGSWAGPVGEAVLEETWNPPKAGTLAAVVRMAGPQGTQFIELIVITEEEDALVLRIQQFNASFEPLFEPAQALRATSQGDRTVTFEAQTTGGLRKLVYTRPSDDEFNIDVTLTEGTQFQPRLKAQ